MFKKIKPKITKAVMLSVKHHWLLLVLIIGTLYITGESMVEPKEWLDLSRKNLFAIHSLTAKLALASTVFLAMEKLYLYLLRRKKI